MDDMHAREYGHAKLLSDQTHALEVGTSIPGGFVLLNLLRVQADLPAELPCEFMR